MTIVAGNAQYRRDFWRRRIGGHEIVSRHDRRIRARRTRELQQGERHNAHAKNPFQRLFHSIGTEALRELWPCGQALNHQAVKSVSHPRQ
jgi:hypothetical protein